MLQHIRFIKKYGVIAWCINYRQGLRNRADQLAGRWPI